MINILQSLSKTIHVSVILAILLFIGLYIGADGFGFDKYFFSWLFRYFHVLAGIMWIGLLWYLNFVQIPNMPKITDEQKPVITKIITPSVLFWFRWAAVITILTGLIVAYLNGYLHEAMTLGIGSDYGKNTAIGIGMWLGIIMAYNVWFIIWPNQKKALGIIDTSADEKPIAAKKAMLTSRINTLLSNTDKILKECKKRPV